MLIAVYVLSIKYQGGSAINIRVYSEQLTAYRAGRMVNLKRVCLTAEFVRGFS